MGFDDPPKLQIFNYSKDFPCKTFHYFLIKFIIEIPDAVTNLYDNLVGNFI